MSSLFKHKSERPKADTGPNTASWQSPSINIEEEPPNLPKKGLFRQKAKEKLRDLFSIRPSHTRSASRTPSERATRQSQDPIFVDRADKDQSVVVKNDFLESAGLLMSAGDRGSEEAKAGKGDVSVNFPKDGIFSNVDKQVLQDTIEVSNSRVQGMRTIGGDIQKITSYGVQSTTVLDNADSAVNILKPLKVFDSVVKGLSDVHPYAKAALSVLFWASQAIINQANRDKAIQGLQEKIANVYGFLLGDGRLEELISMRDILSHASQVIYECAKFIQVYSQPNFLNRLGKGIFSDTDDAVARYSQTIDDLMQDFYRFTMKDVLTGTHDTLATTRRTLEDIRQLGDNQYLDKIAYAEGAGLDTGKACLDGTREEIQHEVIDWIDDADPDAPRILWLSGPVGTGKSAIAHSIARAMKDSGALGSCFCFKRGDVNRYTKMLTTISCDLATRDLRLKHVLASVVSRDRSLGTTTDIMQQWENLIKEPLSSTSGGTIGRLVIVIDALDESGDPRSRKHILSILSKHVADLPNNIRILITSRPLPDIRKAFDDVPHIKHRSMDEIPLSLTERDIQAYIFEQLKDADYAFSADAIITLAKKADGLFEWARLACDYIMSDSVGLSEQEHFEILVSMTGTELLDDMYIFILKEIMGEKPEQRVLIRFRSVMRHVLFTLEPLPLGALITMQRCVQPERDQYDAESTVLRRMGSLLSGIHDQFIPVRPLHSSLHDFLIDEKRSGEFFVNESDGHLDLTLASLYIMQSELCFNICQLQSSYLRNSDVQDLAQRVKEYISPQLSYSCRFLGYHMDGVAFRVHVAAILEDILCTEVILYWIETMTVLQSIPGLLQCLSTIANWLENNVGYEQMMLVAMDGIRLLQNFGGMISESVPHLYLSALPFLPQDSILSKLLLLKFPFTAKVVSGQLGTWPPFGCVLTGHTDIVRSVTFTHDGKWVASGSEDSTIRIWDTEIGLLVAGPFKGHTDAVMSVAFSPDDKLLVSGSKDMTVCVWDITTGSLIWDPLRRHSNWIWSVAFSPNGDRFVSCSSDNTICIWDTAVGTIIGNPLEGHTSDVFCVAFSPDGQRIISGSNDMTIQTWDANTGLSVCKPFQGHTDAIWSIAFSHDGSKIVSSSDDQTICIWDANTGMQMCKPLQGHSEHVGSIAVSPNGQWILSASGDHTIRAWDFNTGIPLSSPFRPHAKGVRSVAISQDGKRIASGSWDHTVYIGDVEVLQVGKVLQWPRGSIYSVDISPNGKHIVSGSQDGTVFIWNVETGSMINNPLVGHKKEVASVAFSPDGMRIASGSDDSTVCIWNLKDGQQLGSPLEGEIGRVHSITFSPDSQQIVSSSDYGKICLWDINSGSQLGSLIQVHNSTIWAVAFSPDGEKIASGSQDGVICILDIKDPKVWSSFIGHACSVSSVAWSPDGDKIVSCSEDKTIVIWDARTRLQVGESLLGHTSLVKSVVFSQDGNRIISGSFDKTIRMWNINSRQQVGYSLKGHTAFVTSVASFPSENQAVSSSYDGKIRVWDLCNDSKTGDHVNFSSSPQHSLWNAEDLFNGTPHLAEDWKAQVGLNDNGWIVGPHGKLLLWIPIQLRSLLHTPGTVSVLPAGSVELDLSIMAHGKGWTNCFNSGNSNKNGNRR